MRMILRNKKLFEGRNKQVGAELCQAQVKLEVVVEVVAEVGCRDCI